MCDLGLLVVGFMGTERLALVETEDIVNSSGIARAFTFTVCQMRCCAFKIFSFQRSPLPFTFLFAVTCSVAIHVSLFLYQAPPINTFNVGN